MVKKTEIIILMMIVTGGFNITTNSTKSVVGL